MQQRIDSLAQQVEHNTFNVGVLGSSPRRITQTKSKTMKTADNQSLSAVFFLSIPQIEAEYRILLEVK